MVDSERRKKLALYLRHLSVGLISNDEFENNLMDDVTKGWLPEQYYRDKNAKFDDPIIIPIAELGWSIYTDTKNHKLSGNYKLSDEALKIVARCILFLHSGQEYTWPHFDKHDPSYRFSLKDIALSLLTFGKYYRNKRTQQEKLFVEYQQLSDMITGHFLGKKIIPPN